MWFNTKNKKIKIVTNYNSSVKFQTDNYLVMNELLPILVHMFMKIK